MAEGDARASWVVLLVLCGVPGPQRYANRTRVFASEQFRAVGSGTAIGLVNTGGQLTASFGGPLYGALLDRGLGFGAVWGTATALGLLRVLAVLGLREPARR